MSKTLKEILNQRPVRLESLAKILEISEQDCKKMINDLQRNGDAVMYRGGWRSTEGLEKATGTVIRQGNSFIMKWAMESGGENTAWLGPKNSRLLVAGDILSAWLIIDEKGSYEACPIKVEARPLPYEHARIRMNGSDKIAVLERRQDSIEIPFIGEALDGDLVKIKINGNGFLGKKSSCTLEYVISNASAPRAEADFAMDVWGFKAGFSEASLNEAQQALRPSLESDRRDMRDIPFVTIDGAYTKDLDDAIHAEKTDKGWRLTTAIADVSHYVKPGSALDEEARKHLTSVYLPGRTLPMLPELLSNGLCSLNPNEDRMAMVCSWDVSPDGSVDNVVFEKALIRSSARLTYEGVSDFLEGKSNSMDPVVASTLKNLNDASLLMSNGPAATFRLDMSGVSYDMVLGDDVKIDHIVQNDRRIADLIVEECMLMTNHLAAKTIWEKGGQALFRNHFIPTKEASALLNETVSKWGLSLNNVGAPSGEDYKQLLNDARDAGRYDQVRSEILKVMESAIYSASNEGHFSLALSAYLHFTSPIRRYPDLMVHRIIKTLVFGETEDQNENMELLAEKCTLAAKKAKEAENETRKMLKCEYATKLIGLEQTAVVTSINERGVFVVLEPSNLETYISSRSLPWVFDKKELRWRDENKNVITEGYRIPGKVDSVDVSARKVEFAPAVSPSSTYSSPKI